MKRFPLLLLLLFSVLPIACTEKAPHASFENYLYRLENALDVPDVFTAQHNQARQVDNVLQRYPKKRQLLQPIPAISINLLDFLRLSSCDLQRHIGQRNSSLGKLMLPSQQLLYEYEFIRLAELCLQQLSESDELYPLLATAIKEKRNSLPKVQANAIFTSDEFKTFFSLGSQALSIEVLKTSVQTLASALDTLNQFSQQSTPSASSAEKAYAVIGSSKRVGELRQSIAMVKHYLTQADVLLAYRVEHKPLCLQGRTHPQFDVVNTVFMKFYIGEIQPYISALHQHANTLLTQIEQIQKQALAPQAFKVFWASVYSAELSEWQQFQRAIERHTVQWQRLLKQCGRLPS